jgi:hypothetical protein
MHSNSICRHSSTYRLSYRYCSTNTPHIRPAQITQRRKDGSTLGILMQSQGVDLHHAALDLLQQQERAYDVWRQPRELQFIIKCKTPSKRYAVLHCRTCASQPFCSARQPSVRTVLRAQSSGLRYCVALPADWYMRVDITSAVELTSHIMIILTRRALAYRRGS